MTEANGHSDTSGKGFSTKAIHAGYHPEPEFGAVIPPIYMTSTYQQPYPAQAKVYDYSRAGNPNFSVLEAQVAALEGGKHAVVFSAGLAAFTALTSGLKKGQRAVALKSLYGGTYRLLTKVFAPLDIGLDMVEVGDWEKLEKCLAHEDAKLFYFESPTNPLLEVIDIKRCAELCRNNNVLCVCDNTFATPYCQNPLSRGCDVVIHSSTKYLGGHSDIIGGCLITNNSEVAKQAAFMRLAMGLNPSPFDCWLVTRSLKTLAVRMRQHSETAAEMAVWLSKMSIVEKVYYPGLQEHPDHTIAKEQSTGKGFSGMVSVTFNLSLDDAKRLVSSFRVITLAESLGGVESLVDHPASMTHASIPAEERKAIGLSDGLMRFSFGLEDIEDLKADIEQAVAQVAP